MIGEILGVCITTLPIMASAILSSVLHLIENLDHQSPNPCTNIQQLLNHHLKPTLLTILALLPDAELRETRDDTIQHWLCEVRATAYDVEDVLDNYSFQLLSQSKVNHPTHLTFEDSIEASIMGTIERLDSLASQSESLHLKKLDTESLNLGAPTFPIVSNAEDMAVYGREDDTKRVIELLLSDQRSNLSVVTLVGVQGVGKTTLAELVYNDPLVCQHFDVKGWVCVSEDFNLLRLMKAIVASLNDGTCFYAESSHLRSLMTQELQGKRFLLVLDDVCNEDQSLWEVLCNSLAFGLEGSVVLVTTRKELVAKTIQTVPFYPVDGLSEENCWLLFRHCAFGSSTDASANLNLVFIGQGIVKKCKGLPLAVKMISSSLTSERNEQIWQTILQSVLWDSDVETVDAKSPALILSYLTLPACLKRCFAYCALFPKDYLFKKDALVQYWMAEGFIQRAEGKRIEDEGVEYFDELLRRSFFQYSYVDRDTFLCSVHDLARSVSRYEICRVQDENLCFASSEVRHLSMIPQDFVADRRIQFTLEPVAWRTFLMIHRLLSSCAVSFLMKANRLQLRFPIDIFIKFGCLRTLDLSETKITRLPDSLGDLRHLRYLGLNHSRIEKLPESLSNLYNLQTLILSDCNNLSELPKGIKNLSDLRHLYLPVFARTIPLPPGIGFLTNLQTLSTFYVGSEPCVIAELANLVNLRGEIVIGGLENVLNIDNAKGVLEDKEYLTKLIFSFGARFQLTDPIGNFNLFDLAVEDLASLKNIFDTSLDDEGQACSSRPADDDIQQEATNQKINAYNEEAKGLEEQLFENLRPHCNLGELHIKSHHSAILPTWVSDPAFSKLVSIRLDGCSNCKVLPPLGRLPSLRHLAIEQLSELEHIGHEFCGQDDTPNFEGFPSLETLHFGSMYKWEEWTGTSDCDFPRLRLLHLSYCPKLRRMPRLLISHEKLVMRFWFCPELTALPTVPSLTSLEIQGYCNTKMLLSISEESLNSLQSLKISECKDLTCLPWDNLVTLRYLEISHCQENPSTCHSLGPHLSNLTSLKQLKVLHCPRIWLAPDQQLPSTLQLLYIDHCPLLSEWCQEHGRCQLAFIPRVILDKKNLHQVDKNDIQKSR